MVAQPSLEPEMIELLESGCALIVGLVTPSVTPLATRGWGLTIGTGDEPSRLLVTAADIAGLEPTASLVGRWLAVTGCHIRTLRSMQLKGPIASVEAPTELDEARADRYCDAYFESVLEVDNIPRHMMERTRARAVVALTFELHEVYDQTPGPGAGAAVTLAVR